jgi:hypothetical protein
MKKVLKICAVIAIVFLALNLVKNLVIQSILGSALSGAAHVPVSIGNTDAKIIASSIRLKNITVKNPKEFSDRQMIDMPQIYIDFDPAALFKGVAHFQEVRLDLKEVVVVKNRDGKVNIDAVKPTEDEKKKQKEEVARKKETKPKEKQKAPKLQIDKLYLSIGRVLYKDYSGGGEPKIQTFDVNIKERLYTNIQNPSGVVSLIMLEVLTNTTLSRLVNLDPSIFRDGALGALSGSLGLVGDGADAFEDTAKGLVKLFQ